MSRRFFALCLLWYASFVCPPRVLAHPLSPVVLAITEQSEGEYDVSFRRAAASPGELSPVLPPRCKLSGQSERVVLDQRELRAHASCGSSLRGDTLSVQGLAAQELSALVYVAFRAGDNVHGVLAARAPVLDIPRAATTQEAFEAYFAFGFTHLTEGADHLLFVLGLCWLSGELSALLFALTAFTLGHSVTLALSASGVISLPAKLTELGIALSLLVLAFELARRDRALGARSLSGFAFTCGLLHGLGFAAALGDAGLPRAERTTCLLAFNLGLEVAQIAWVACLLGAYAAVRWLARTDQRQQLRARLRWLVAHAIGGLAFMWCLERLP